MLVIGDNEARDKKIAVRSRKAGDIGQMSIEDFINKVKSTFLGEHLVDLSDSQINAWIDSFKVMQSLNLNPNSIQVLKECYIEPVVEGAQAYDTFQFVRQGYFCVDSKDSKPGSLVFNRIVSLKSSFKLPANNA